MATVLIGIGTAIIIAEILLWRLFHRKIADMRFPPSMDASSIRFFSLHRMRSMVVTHGALLLLSVIIPLWILW